MLGGLVGPTKKGFGRELFIRSFAWETKHTMVSGYNYWHALDGPCLASEH
jgi:hypothetical protein